MERFKNEGLILKSQLLSIFTSIEDNAVSVLSNDCIGIDDFSCPFLAKATTTRISL